MDGLFALQNLLNGNENHSSDDEPSDHLGAKLGPGNIGASKKSDSKKIVDVYGKQIARGKGLILFVLTNIGKF
jgi:hypothetical protein